VRRENLAAVGSGRRGDVLLVVAVRTSDGAFTSPANHGTLPR